MKKAMAWLAAWLCLVMLGGCQPPEEGQDILDPHFTGKVVALYETSCLLEVTDSGNQSFAVGDEVSVNTDIADCPTYAEGDYLTVTFDGSMAMSYPPYIFRVYRITKTEMPT